MKIKHSKARNFFLIIRGDKPEHHNAPYHPIIVCTRKHVMEWESKETNKGATVYGMYAPDSPYCSNWGLIRYKGYLIDSVGLNLKLFDGNELVDLVEKEAVEKLVNGATWWSYDEMPEYFQELGSKYPEDDFTKKMILDDLGDCMLPYSKQGIVNKLEEKYGEPHWLKY